MAYRHPALLADFVVTLFGGCCTWSDLLLLQCSLYMCTTCMYVCMYVCIGEFGTVFQGIWKEQPKKQIHVAVKTLKVTRQPLCVLHVCVCVCVCVCAACVCECGKCVVGVYNPVLWAFMYM